MNSDDPDRLERNVSQLVRRGVLPLDEARTANARREFLARIDDAPRASKSWTLPAMAASLLACATVFWAVRSERPVKPAPAPLEIRTPESTVVAPRPYGNDAVKGLIRILPGPAPSFRFEGRSTLPDGLIFVASAGVLEEKLVNGRLEASLKILHSGLKPLYENGRFFFEWPSSEPGLVRVEIRAPDDQQTIQLVKSLKMKEADRIWTFDLYFWDDTLLNRAGVDYTSTQDLLMNVDLLIAACRESCATEALLKDRKASLLKEIEKLQGRAGSLMSKSLLPLPAQEAGFVLGDLSRALEGWVFEAGKAPGPKSYYTPDKRMQTHRQEPFTFEALNRYTAAATAMGGREMALWVVKDLRRAGVRPTQAIFLKHFAKIPGLEEFVARLSEPAGLELDRIEAEIRAIEGPKKR